MYLEQIYRERLYLGGEAMAKKTEEPNMLQTLKEEIRQGEPARLYFFYGEEAFLLHHYLKQLQV